MQVLKFSMCPHGLHSCQRAPRSQTRVVRVSAQHNRRDLLSWGLVLPAAWAVVPSPASADSVKSKFEPMEALKDKDYGKPRYRYEDFVLTETGLQYKDLREGTGEQPKPGDIAVVDWSGYTIGYYGRPFEARNKPKGSSFDDDKKDYVRFTVGNGEFIQGFEEAVQGMKVGGVRRVVVPVELGYPEDNWRTKGPKPSTFTGDRALDFVLTNKGMIDKTLLFDIELKNLVHPQ